MHYAVNFANKDPYELERERYPLCHKLFSSSTYTVHWKKKLQIKID